MENILIFTASATIINISKSREIHIGNNLTINMNGNDKLKKTDIPETSAIKSLKQSKIPITKKDLLFAATHMDSEWKGVARALNIGEGQISQFIADNQIYGTKEVCFTNSYKNINLLEYISKYNYF